MLFYVCVRKQVEDISIAIGAEGCEACHGPRLLQTFALWSHLSL